MSATARANAEAFLKIASQFQLGVLPTEQSHPLTVDMARQSREDLPTIIETLKAIDVGVLETVASKEAELKNLASAIWRTTNAGRHVYLYGCGATGRLSLSLEYLNHVTRRSKNYVHGFMSGGDLALVHSIESFEDHPEWGARQLREIGFKPGDLLIAITEGGETPSVIGAVEEAARMDGQKPFFVYCNPTDVLKTNVERSRRVLQNKRIESVELFVGPMALSGSTRMQATTAQMLFVGAALFGVTREAIEHFAEHVKETDFSFLQPFIEAESALYKEGGHVLYETDRYGITVMTDTTERAPTFSLKGFENQLDPAREASLSYLCLPGAANAAAAWRELLGRDPKALEWPELNGVARRERLLNFDFSQAARGQRQVLTRGHEARFSIGRFEDDMLLTLRDERHAVDVYGLHPLFEHLLLKMMLNTHSTLVMGRMGRFESNVMTWVKPSNNKLIDRAIRYVDHLLVQQGATGHSYESIAHNLFEAMETLKPGEPIVIKTLDHMNSKARRAMPVPAP